MRLFNRLLEKIPSRTIRPDCPEGKVGPALMTRYFLFRRERFAVYLHRFHRSDMDEFHDHPWTFVSFLIGGGYWEHMPWEQFVVSITGLLGVGGKREFLDGDCEHMRVWRPRFSILYRPAEWQHFVEIDRPVWTLVVRFKERREWGFIRDGVWTMWKNFEDMKSRSICEDGPIEL